MTTPDPRVESLLDLGQRLADGDFDAETAAHAALRKVGKPGVWGHPYALARMAVVDIAQHLGDAARIEGDMLFARSRSEGTYASLAVEAETLAAEERGHARDVAARLIADLTGGRHA